MLERLEICLAEPLEPRRLFNAAALPPAALDPHWQQSDIGSVALARNATTSHVKSAGLVFNLIGSGVIGGIADSLHFVYQTMWGNGKIIARIDSQTGATDPLAQVGLMLRESLLPQARMVTLGLTPTGAPLFSQRSITNDPAVSSPFQPAIATQWLKIVRAGNTFTTYVSPNRNRWQVAGSVQIPLTVNLDVGMFVASNDPALQETAAFQNVQVSSQGKNAQGWHSAAPAPINVYEAASATVNGKLYVFGGFDNPQTQATAQSDMYDPATNTWTRLADMPFVVTHSGVAVVGTDIYFAGGFLGDWVGPNLTDQTNQVIVYNTLTNTWSSIAPLPASRAAGGLVLIGQQLHFFGGTDEFVQSDMSDHWVYDLSNPSAGWVAKAPLPDARDHFGYASLNGMIYAVGGEHLTDEIACNDSEVDQYNPATDIWTTVAPLPVASSHFHTNTIVVNGRIVIFGGSADGASEATILSTVYDYDPKHNRWLAMPPLPEPRSAIVGRVVGSEIVLTGGENELSPQLTTWTMDEKQFQRQLMK
jgi:N-acetylneuraminic acid mutarotase